MYALTKSIKETVTPQPGTVPRPQKPLRSSSIRQEPLRFSRVHRDENPSFNFCQLKILTQNRFLITHCAPSYEICPWSFWESILRENKKLWSLVIAMKYIRLSLILLTIEHNTIISQKWTLPLMTLSYISIDITRNTIIFSSRIDSPCNFHIKFYGGL